MIYQLTSSLILFVSLTSSTVAFTCPKRISHVIKSEQQLNASRRSFLAEKVVLPSALLIAFDPKLSNGVGVEDDGDIFKQAAARMTARNKERKAERATKEADESDDGFVFGSKVKEIQDGIIERKERAILLDEQETKRTEENDFIKELKARSAANQEQYRKQSMQPDKLSSNQFSDQYKRPSYLGVRTSDGSTKMILSTEVESLMKENKIKAEYEIGVGRDGNEFLDRSKKYLIFVEEEGKKASTSTTLDATESMPAVMPSSL